MLSEQSFFAQLLKVAQVSHHRFGIVLRGEENWQQQLCFVASQMVEGDCFQLGGEAKTYAQQWRSMSKGQQLLGHECHLLVCDLRAEFDANSITSILGTLCGGGLAIFLHSARSEGNAAQQWLDRALQQLLVIEQGKPLPSLPSMPSCDVTESASFAAQEQAIALIKKVVTGHRRRPLVLTADRGRGKTSALGIASAQLMLERNIHVVVTSPNIGNVTPLFDHAARLLKGAERSKLKLNWQNSSIQFIAPDEVVRGEFECDLLLVDEAAAIPLPMLQSMVAKFHRTVFSSTIHGYEGCGRGFSLKFQAWLEQHRPGCRFFHMQTPIRWADEDPLEKWQYQTFLLNTDLPPSQFSSDAKLELVQLDKLTLLNNPNQLQQCFALLVNAHYQTTPNDLMLLLSDPAIKLFAVFESDVCVACIIAVEEGGLEQELINNIIAGKRRPKGQLVASSLVTQLASSEPGIASSLRVMRIAVHPEWQRNQVGQLILSQLEQATQYQFLSTSFGVTYELLSFWRRCGYRVVKLGSQRDQASGCYSIIMVKGAQTWIDEAAELFSAQFQFQVTDLYRDIDIDLICGLAQEGNSSVSFAPTLEQRILNNYACGGSSYENVVAVIAARIWRDSMSSERALTIRKCVQQWSWCECAKEFGLAGRKQVEQQLRIELTTLLNR